MKLSAIALTSALLVPGLAAAEASQIEACTSVSELAEVVMEKRQGGARMSELVRIVQGNDLHVTIVTMAYDSPRYSTDRVQQREINDYTNEWFAACMRATEE